MTTGASGSLDGEDMAALYARLAEAARVRYDEVDLGFHEPAGPREPRVPSARFRPAGPAITMPSRHGGARDVQVESAIALGLPRWNPDAPPSTALRWQLRLTDSGLDLLTPTRVIFTRGRRLTPRSWRTAAVSHGFVLVSYGHDSLAAGLVRCLDGS